MMPNSIPSLKLSTIAQAAKIACTTPGSSVSVEQGQNTASDVIESAASASNSIIAGPQLRLQGEIWQLYLPDEIVSKFTELDVKGIEHQQLVETLGMPFLSKIANTLRTQEKRSVYSTIWGLYDTLTIELSATSGRIRQVIEAYDDSRGYDDNYSEGLEGTNGISFRVPPIRAFSNNDLGSWTDPNAPHILPLEEIETTKSMFCYIIRPDKKILVQIRSGIACLPYSGIAGLNLMQDFSTITEEMSVILEPATGSLGEITEYSGAVTNINYCYIKAVSIPEIPLKEGYQWMDRDKFLSRPISVEPTFVDFASTRFVEEALRKGVAVGDPIYDPKKSL